MQIYFIVCLYVLPLENQLSKEEVLDPINRFDPTTFVCLSQSRNVIFPLHMCSVSSIQMTVIACFVDIGRIVDHHCLEVIVLFFLD